MRQVAWLRVQRAIARLRLTGLTAAAIAREVGLGDGPRLVHACRRLTGRTPSQHRRAP